MRKSRYPVLSRGSLMKQLTALFSFPANSRRTPGFNIIRPRFHVSGHTNLRPVCNTEWRRCRPSRPQVIPSACSSPRVASRNIYLARRFGIMQNAVEIRSSRPKLAHERASNDTQRPITHCARLCSRPWPLRLSPPPSPARGHYVSLIRTIRGTRRLCSGPDYALMRFPAFACALQHIVATPAI